MPSPRPKPIVLAVIDGWGVAPPWGGNAVTLARTTFYNKVRTEFPNTTLLASGEAVGLPKDERGNSEVGHLSIGSGQVAHQALPEISAAIKDGSFYKNPTILEAMTRAKTNGKAVHLMGLCSDGGIHSHITHLFALLEMAKAQGLTDVCIHAITDGRDTAPFASEEYCAQINEKIKQIGVGRICTVAGRYYTMDRDHRWERIEKSYRAMTEGVGLTARTAEAAVASAYRDGFSDEFIIPTTIHGDNNSFRTIQDGDSVIFFNFRGDRAREICQAFMNPEFKEFNRRKVLKDLYFVGFTFYQEGLPIEVAFRPRDIQFPIARIIADNKLKQLHVAESEKYAHVTYFFNGGREEPFPNCDRIVVPSPKVPSFDQVPAMSTETITETVITHLASYDFVIYNYACPDMVGHTGNLRAAILACEAVDKSLEEVSKAVDKLGGLLIVTADHGNAEQMVNPKTGEPDTEHTANPVPFIMIGSMVKGLPLRPAGTLADVSPTILQLMGLPKPDEMTGTSLIADQAPAESPVPAAVAATS